MSKKTDNLILYLVPPEKIVNGGILSIFSLCEETRKLKDIHHSEVVLCTYIGYPSYHKNDRFKNNEYIYDFDEIVEKFPNAKNLTINVPELAVVKLASRLREYEQFLKGLKDLHINIMNQNIKYMPAYLDTLKLLRYTSHITQTTAHDKYSTQAVCDKYSIPLKHMSVYLDKKQYRFTTFDNKQKIIAYSPDHHPEKEAILKKIMKSHPDYQLIEIREFTYEEYKDIVSRSKFMITFGEGLDGYFIESSFSGGVPFAVYNEDFFPSSEYKKMPNVYSSYDEMLKHIADDISGFDTSSKYVRINTMLINALSKLYNSTLYRDNLKAFYLGHFDFIPNQSIQIRNYANGIKELLVEASNQAADHRAYTKAMDDKLSSLTNKNESLSSQLNLIRKSWSWRITKPLRFLSHFFRR